MPGGPATCRGSLDPTQSPSRPARAWTVKERKDQCVSHLTAGKPRPREEEWLVQSRAGGEIPEPQPSGSQAGETASAPTLVLSAPRYCPPPWVLGNPVGASLGALRDHREKEGPARVSGPRPRTCRSLGSRQSPASGASRERRPASPAPTAGLRAEQQPGTALPPARRKWLRAGPSHRAHAPERRLPGGRRELRGGGWAGTAGGRGARRSLKPARHVSRRPNPRRRAGWLKHFFPFFFFF